MNKFSNDKFLDDDYQYQEFLEHLEEGIPDCINCGENNLVFAPSTPEHLLCLSCGHEFIEVNGEIKFR